MVFQYFLEKPVPAKYDNLGTQVYLLRVANLDSKSEKRGLKTVSAIKGCHKWGFEPKEIKL